MGGNSSSTHSFAELSDLCLPNPSLLSVFPFDLIVCPHDITPWADALHSVYVFWGSFRAVRFVHHRYHNVPKIMTAYAVFSFSDSIT